MTKIAINLLPSEFKTAELKAAKFYKIQFIGVGMILVLIFLSSLSIALGVLQSQRVKQAESELNSISSKITGFQDKQVSLLALKNRLTAINQYVGVPSLQASMFVFLQEALPPSLIISSFMVDRSGDVSISGAAMDSATLENIVIDLTRSEKNKGKIKEVSIEGLSRGRDGIYKLNLRIKPGVQNTVK